MWSEIGSDYDHCAYSCWQSLWYIAGVGELGQVGEIYLSIYLTGRCDLRNSQTVLVDILHWINVCLIDLFNSVSDVFVKVQNKLN